MNLTRKNLSVSLFERWNDLFSVHWDISPNKVVAIETINPFTEGWDVWLKHNIPYGQQGFNKGKWEYNRQLGFLGVSLLFNITFGENDDMGCCPVCENDMKDCQCED